MIENSLLWRISHQYSTEYSYLFGTMHVRDIHAFERADEITHLFVGGYHLYLETNLDMANSKFAQQTFSLDDTKHFDKCVKPKSLLKCQRIIQKSFGFNVMKFNSTHPIALSSALASSVLENSYSVPLDQYLWNYAQSSHVFCDGLESLEEQMQVVHSMDIEKQFRNIIAISKKPESYRKRILKLIELYRDENIIELLKVSKKGMGSDKNLMLKERNFRMADRIAKKSKVHKAVFAIGAGHLAGKNGILNLLKQKGFTVKPISRLL